MADNQVTRIGPGTFSVTTGDTRAIVYVAGDAADRWTFWNGYVFHGADPGAEGSVARSAGPRVPTALSLTAPMPAKVVKVLVTEGVRVAKGETVVVLEAMKMELPIRALADAIVKAVRCRDGDLVKADQPLIDLE